MPPYDQRNYFAVAEEIVEVAVKNNAEITAEEIAEMVVECCGGAIADYIDEESAEDKELAKEMVVEEIRGVISKRISVFKSIQKREKLIKAITERKLSNPKDTGAIMELAYCLELEIEDIKKGLNK